VTGRRHAAPPPFGTSATSIDPRDHLSARPCEAPEAPPPERHASAPDTTPNTPSPALIASTAARLQPFCGSMSAEDFEALVVDVARFTARWSPVRRPPR
jgi:hypothetical protein